MLLDDQNQFKIGVRIYLRAKDECTFDADVVHNHTAEVATNHHQAERERIACIDKMG